MESEVVKLRRTIEDDLPFLFQFQLDPEGSFLAAFTPKDQFDREAYLNRFRGLLQQPKIHTETILVNETIVGSVAKFEIGVEAELTYWIDRNYWGKGIATTALKTFLTLETTRPIYGRVAFDNLGSQKVLEKCGFIKIGTDRGFAKARQQEIEEFIFKLP